MVCFDNDYGKSVFKLLLVCFYFVFFASDTKSDINEIRISLLSEEFSRERLTAFIKCANNQVNF